MIAQNLGGEASGVGESLFRAVAKIYGDLTVWVGDARLKDATESRRLDQPEWAVVGGCRQ